MPQGSRALQIAEEAVHGGADWIEAGTPLIKSEGIGIVRQLKQRCPGKTIVADLKTMDVGALEADMAAKMGADVVVVMGVAGDSTIGEAVRAATKSGAKVMVDMMAVSNPLQRAVELAPLGISYICLHVGVDQQMHGEMADPSEWLRDSPVGVAVAGGINSESAGKLVAAGAEIIIVGGAITKSPDVAVAVRTIKRAMETSSPVESPLFRRYSEEKLAEAFSKVSTANICDAQHRQGAMRGIVQRSGKERRMIGRAVTVQTAAGDWAKPVEAIDIAKPGDVIVVDAGGGERAVWGELASRSAIRNNIAGLVVDGAIRDLEEIRESGFPCYSRFVSPEAGEPMGFGGIGPKIMCGGVTVRNGDWIIGDSDGVVVVPVERAAEIANRALDVLERENRLREEIARGSTLSKVQDLKKWEKA